MLSTSCAAHFCVDYALIISSDESDFYQRRKSLHLVLFSTAWLRIVWGGDSVGLCLFAIYDHHFFELVVRGEDNGNFGLNRSVDLASPNRSAVLVLRTCPLARCSTHNHHRCHHSRHHHCVHHHHVCGHHCASRVITIATTTAIDVYVVYSGVVSVHVNVGMLIV